MIRMTRNILVSQCDGENVVIVCPLQNTRDEVSIVFPFEEAEKLRDKLTDILSGEKHDSG